jgi:transglutaminase-like putative cysteine protease
MRVDGADLSSPDLQGVGQRIDGNIVEIIDAQKLVAGPLDDDLALFLSPEAFIESDDPDIRAAAEEAVGRVVGTRARAEALTRFVNSTVQKKPTVSLPSAREVLRTRIGDCNEHTALFVAMSRSVGIPARIAVGLAFVRGAFYYHAWPEIYIDEGATRGYWLPVDPTFNQFPADATHFRLARGGLDKQATIIPLIGRVKITMVDLEVVKDSTAVLVGQTETAIGAPIALPPELSGSRGQTPSRWCLPCFLGGHQ